ncbi:MAG: DUF370 domain-containing protein [Ruminococcaceae bacterium]|nr:DUF370 domain-containing protein [Oscillospiraceae bacterium]
MYLHLGNDILVLTKDVIGIFDIENSTISKATKNFLASSEKAGRVINVSTELPKSFIICKEKNSETVSIYISQISPTTLRKRAGFLEEISNV